MVCSAQGLAEHNHEVDEVHEVRALIHEVTGTNLQNRIRIELLER